MNIKIIYTSDTHGRLSAYDFLNKNYGPFGLSRLSTFIKHIDTPYLLLDNGDYLQGSPLLDYTRKQNTDNPVAKIFNALNYTYMTIGNHDFNYGFSYLKDFQKLCRSEILCANILKQGKPYFKPYAMFKAQDIKIAIIGVTTEYIPFWEKPEHLNDLKFVDAVKSIKDIIIQNNLKEKADLIVVLYHGGFNKNLETNQSYGPPTIENKGYELFQLEDVDVLLTGHQHIPQVYSKNNRIALQTSSNAHDFGLVSVEYQKIDDSTTIQSISGSIVKLEQYLVDDDIESKIDKDIKMTNTFLSQKIGFSSLDMTISSPLACRVKKHPLFQLINQIQLDYTKADISAASLPNETHGFPDQISLNDIAVNFPFENDLVVLEVTGAILKEALEYNANYFSIKDNQIIINPKYLFPKVEHYNYDVYDGIEYEMDISKSSGNRITVLKINHEPVKDKSTYKLVLNSYRSIGSGGFDMFKKAKIIMSYPVSYFDLIKSHIEKHPKLDFKIVDNFKVIK